LQSDAGKVGQILINLLSNAEIHASRHGQARRRSGR
jgi:hypothetical protein